MSVLNKNKIHFSPIKYTRFGLAGVAQWTEHQSVNQRVAGSIPSQGTCLGCRLGPQLEACERQSVYVSLACQCFSPTPSPSLPLSLKINKYFKKYIIFKK